MGFSKFVCDRNSKTSEYQCFISHVIRVADVGGARERRSTKGKGLLRKEGPPTYGILSRNLVLSRFTRFLKGFHRALNESHPAFNFQRKLSCFLIAFNENHPAFVELSTKVILLSQSF